MAGKGQDRRFGEKAAALPWLAISVRLAKRQCLAFAPRPAPPAATGVNEKTNLQQKKPSPHVRLKPLIGVRACITAHGPQRLGTSCVSAMTRRGLIVSVVSSTTFYKSFRCHVSSDSGVAHASYERGAATPYISCQRGLSTEEFHEGRLAEARTARPPTRLGASPRLLGAAGIGERRIGMIDVS